MYKWNTIYEKSAIFFFAFEDIDLYPINSSYSIISRYFVDKKEMIYLWVMVLSVVFYKNDTWVDYLCLFDRYDAKLYASFENNDI